MTFRKGMRLTRRDLELRRAASRKGGEATKLKFKLRRADQLNVLLPMLEELQSERPGLPQRAYALLISEKLRKDGVDGTSVIRAPETIRKLLWPPNRRKNR